MSNAPATIVPSELFLELKAKKKITLATFKSFVNKNRDKLFILVGSKFSGMSDMVENTDAKSFHPAKPRTSYSEGEEKPWPIDDKNCLGIAGVWVVGGGGDLFSIFEATTQIDNGKYGAEKVETTGTICGFDVYNCTGSFRIGIITGA